MENKNYYTSRIELCTENFVQANRKYRFLGTLRLVAFSCIGLCLYFFWGANWLFAPVLGLGAIFLFLVHKSADAKYQRDKQQKLIDINKEELNVLEGNWLHFEEGNEYKDPKHAFAHDMDLFGKKSIYQLLNRTVSKKAGDLLAHQLLNGATNIELSNDAIDEFSKHMDWCQEFLSEGMVFNKEDLEKKFNRIGSFKAPQTLFTMLVRYCLPPLSIAATVLFSYDLISSSVFGVYFVVVFALIGRNLKASNVLTAQVTSFAAQVKMFQRQLELYKKLKVNSGLLQENQKMLFDTRHGLVESLNQLEKIQQRMDYRMNLLVGLALNFFLAWDFQVINQWESWRTANKSDLEDWEEQLAQLEVWISGAVYKFNFPETKFAKFSSNDKIHINGLGHPFVSQDKRVLNDVELNDSEHFMIITGPNMAGKSTYLRSLGIAFISANAGFPVMAKACTIPKLKLYSSMRTSDDLTVESSYFHAELTRLRFIMDAIENREKVFIILDEILKGTNSKDKEIGSAKFLEKLQRLNAKGIIATHDLSLCNLANDNTAFRNMYFDSTISGEQLSFDYKIREGICQNMNASFLLKQMNLVD